MARSDFFLGRFVPMRLLLSSSPFRTNGLVSFVIGVASFAIALTMRILLDPLIPAFPFITFIPAVIIAAFLGGTRAGALCAVISFVTTWYLFVDPVRSWSISLNGAIGLALFAFIIAVDIAIIAIAAKALEELAAKTAQLNTIVETVPVGLVMAEFPSGRIIGGNKYVEYLLGHPVIYSPNVTGYTDWVSYHEDGSRVQGYEYPLAAMMRGEECPSLEVLYQRGDGSKAWTRILGRPVRDINGVITGGVAALIDIDGQRKAQAALKDALHSKELLLQEVNHRVKNSLHLVNSFLLYESLKLTDLSAQSAVMAARNKIDLIARVHQLLYESGTHNLVDIRTAITELVNDLVASAGRGDVNLNIKFSDDVMINISEASPLVLIVNEIVTNSLKYGLVSENPNLTVDVIKLDENLFVTIADNGPGIPLISEKKASLGSEIVEGLVHQMRGEISVQSSSLGTTVILTVPIDCRTSGLEGLS